MPERIKVSDRIIVTHQSDQKIDATVSVNDTITITFAQPVPTGTALLVSIKDFRTRSPFLRTWLYPVYSRSVGINADVPIGMARIQTY